MHDAEDNLPAIEWSEGWARAAWESANAAGRTAVNSIILVSGGAVVALFALAGSMLGRQTTTASERAHLASALESVGISVTLFGLSVVVAILVAGLTYFSQLANASATESQIHAVATGRLRLANQLNNVAIGLGIFALASLVGGAMTVVLMLKNIAGILAQT